MSARSLAKAIFAAEVPEEFVKTLPAQSIYFIIQHNGLEAAGDIIALTTDQQYRGLLDLHLWDGDTLSEDRWWEWLASIDESESLNSLQKFLSLIDLKLLSLMITRHVESITLEEPTDRPPAAHFYTPDKGYTWVHIKLEAAEQHRLMGKLMALLFQVNAELFYRILGLSTISSAPELEEESFQDRERRMNDHGFPSHETAAALNAGIKESQVKAMINGSAISNAVDLQLPSSVAPLVYDADVLQPLGGLMAQVNEPQRFESELTLISNSALIFYRVPFYEHEQVLEMLARVKGAINIGLERLTKVTSATPVDAYSKLGLQTIYQFGLDALFTLRTQASSIARSGAADGELQGEMFSLLAGARERFPVAPKFFGLKAQITDGSGNLLGGFRAFEHFDEVLAVQERLKQRFGN